jgi:hypothetical protein
MDWIGWSHVAMGGSPPGGLLGERLIDELPELRESNTRCCKCVRPAGTSALFFAGQTKKRRVEAQLLQ